MMKAFRFRLYPTAKQAEQINKNCGCKRFVYNHMLEHRQEVYKTSGRSLSTFDCNNLLPALKEEFPFLKEVDSTSLQAANDDLQAAYNRFFKKQGGFPQFHRKGHNDSFTTKASSLKVEGARVFLPKMGWVRFAKSREPEGKIKRATVSRTPSGRYYVSILCEADIEPLPVSPNSCGVDMGYRALVTLDDGTAFENPKALHALETKLAQEQRKLSRRTKGSANWEKQRVKVARLQEHITNIRRDALHKVSTSLIRENQTICIEDLKVRNMVKNRRLAKVNSDVGYRALRTMLAYKAQWYGRTIVVIPGNYASSKTCSSCGTKNTELKAQKYWTCPVCGTRHNRDRNAAINILRKGISMLAA